MSSERGMMRLCCTLCALIIFSAACVDCVTCGPLRRGMHRPPPPQVTGLDELEARMLALQARISYWQALRAGGHTLRNAAWFVEAHDRQVKGTAQARYKRKNVGRKSNRLRDL